MNFPMNESSFNNLKNQDGQSFVEFVLLMAVIVMLSLGFLKVVNTGVASFWKNSVRIIVDDKTVRLNLRGE